MGLIARTVAEEVPDGEKKYYAKRKRDDLPDAFQSIAEAGAFWDSHDSADYEDMMEDVDFETDIKRQIYLVPISGAILGGLRKRPSRRDCQLKR